MPRTSRKKPRPRTRKPGAYTDFENARDELRGNGPRARWALDELERMAKGESTYGTLPPALTILCLKEILTYEGLPKALQFKAAEGLPGDQTITINVQPWAAAGPRRIGAPVAPAIETTASRESEAEVVEPDDPERIVAFNRQGVPVSAKRLAELKDTCTDLSGFVLAPTPENRSLAAIDANHGPGYAIFDMRTGADGVARPVQTSAKERQARIEEARAAGKLNGGEPQVIVDE